MHHFIWQVWMDERTGLSNFVKAFVFLFHDVVPNKGLDFVRLFSLFF